MAGQSARWAGTRAANLVRTPERADAATGERALALAHELVEQLGQLRGAAMKVGQVLSTLDFPGIPEEERESFKATLASLRDDVPPLPFQRVRKLLESELGERLGAAFSEFDEEAFAAASIGQVHRAVTADGRPVAVKIQYPGVAEAVETDLRNAALLMPLVKRLAPGLDTRRSTASCASASPRSSTTSIEAQNQRAVARAFRGHPFAYVPAVDTALSTRRVLVTELLEGRRFEEVKRLDEPERDRFGEIVFRFYFGLLAHLGRVCGDPHPGNYLLLADGSVGFLDFGLMRSVDAAYLDGERAIAPGGGRPRRRSGQASISRGSATCRSRTPSRREALLAQIEAAGDWYFQPGFRRLSPAYVAEVVERGGSPRSPWFEQMRRQTIPPQALLIRRMEGLVFTVLGELRAGADWNALATEFFAGEPAGTPLGDQDRAFWDDRRSTGRPAAA